MCAKSFINIEKKKNQIKFVKDSHRVQPQKLK